LDYSVLIPPVYPPDQLVGIVQWVEENGFVGFWYPDEKFFRDPYVGLTLAANHTRRINLGTCVTDPYARHPILTATAIGSLAELAPGRTWLGIGAGGRGFQAIGIRRDRPVTAIREAVEVIRRLLAGECVDYHGQVIQLNDRPLDFLPPGPVPVLIATGHGPLIQKLAGEIGDAAMLANYASEPTIQMGLGRIREGAQRAGRSLKDLRILSRLDVSIHPQGELARAAVAPRILSMIRASYPELSYFDDLPAFELSSTLLGVLKRKDYATRTLYADPRKSAPLIPNELFRHFSVAGNPDQVGRQLETIRRMGVFDEITFHPIPAGDQSMLNCLTMITGVIKESEP
jgi:5,10-methylenetetrahydromethanopterin reductase